MTHYKIHNISFIIENNNINGSKKRYKFDVFKKIAEINFFHQEHIDYYQDK